MKCLLCIFSFSFFLFLLSFNTMGNDGGSIPRRIELVKEKQKEVKVNPDLERVAAWFYCALSKVSQMALLSYRSWTHPSCIATVATPHRRMWTRQTLQPRCYYWIYAGQERVWRWWQDLLAYHFSKGHCQVDSYTQSCFWREWCSQRLDYHGSFG